MSEKQAPATVETGVCRQATFVMKKKPCHVTLNDTELTWATESWGCSGKTIVRLRDILAVKYQIPVDNNHPATLTVAYATQQQKDYVLTRTEVVFNGDTMTCRSFCQDIDAVLNQVSERPKKLLVFVSPVCGDGNGPRTYKDKVAPIFKEAGIHTDVIVTENDQQLEQILAEYDMKSTDGIVLVSGEGLYHKLANALLRRQAGEIGKTATDPNFTPSEIDMPVGLIPAGCCNTVAKCAMGNNDIQTAAIAIALGYRKKENLMSVFSGKEFVSFATSDVGYGVWGDIMENKHTQSRFRFALSAANTLFLKSFREMNLTISYKTKPQLLEVNKETLQKYDLGEDAYSADERIVESFEQVKVCKEDNKPMDTKPADAKNLYPALESGIRHAKEVEASHGTAKGTNGGTDKNKGQLRKLQHTEDSSSGWNYVDGTFVGFMSTCATGLDTTEAVLDCRIQGLSDSAVLMATLPSKRCEFFASMCKLISGPEEVLSNPIEILPSLLANEWKVTLNNPSDPESDYGRKECVLLIDGEVYNLSVPEFHVRLFPQTMTVFANVPKVTGRAPVTPCRGYFKC